MKKIKSSPYSRFVSLLMVFMMIYMTGCTTYFRYNIASRDPVNIQDIGKMHKYFVVHSGTDIYSLKDISIDTENLSGSFGNPIDSVYYNEKRYFSYNSKDKDILNEVHIYLSESSPKPQLGTFFRPNKGH